MDIIRRGGGYTVAQLPTASKRLGPTLWYTREGQLFQQSPDGMFHLLDIWQSDTTWRPFFWDGRYYRDAIRAISYAWDIEEAEGYSVLPNNAEPSDLSLDNLRPIYIQSPYYQRVSHLLGGTPCK